MSPYLTGCQPWRENPTGFPRFPFRAHTQWYNSLWHCSEDWSWASCQTVPSKHWPIVGSMLGQRLRRWPNMDPTMSECLLFAGRSHRSQIWMRTGVLGLTKQNETFAQCWFQWWASVADAGPTLHQHRVHVTLEPYWYRNIITYRSIMLPRCRLDLPLSDENDLQISKIYISVHTNLMYFCRYCMVLSVSCGDLYGVHNRPYLEGLTD